jgi:1-acyl-sn-glycerol-3-phosphate acyltransferase
MHFLDDLVWASIKGLAWVGSKVYGVNVKGLDVLPTDGPALLAVQHPSRLDLLLVLDLLPKKATIFGSREMFANSLVSYLLRVAGVIPMYSSTGYHHLRNPNLNSPALKTHFFGTLKKGGWVAYAPEAVKEPGRPVSAKLLQRASVRGVPSYLVGIAFKRPNHPWSSFFRLPWDKGVTVRVEHYNAAGKTEAQAQADMTRAFERFRGSKEQAGEYLKSLTAKL